MTEFNLDATIREALERSSSPDPRVIAAEVAKEVPSSHLRYVVETLLPNRVQVALAAWRQVSRYLPGDEEEGRLRPLPRIRRWADRTPRCATFLSRRESIHLEGTHQHVWKFLGDMSASEVLVVAASRRKSAQGHLEAAEEFERLAAQMEQRGVEVVADLPDNVIETVTEGTRNAV
jgi:hypothetical protein